MAGTESHAHFLQYFDMTTITVLVLLLVLCIWYFSSESKLPPGPWGYPLLGILPILRRDKQPYKQFVKWAQKYGEIYTVRIGMHNVVILNSPEIIREAFLKKADFFSARPVYLYMAKRIIDNTGLIWHNGEEFKQLRKFTLTVLKDFGVGKSTLEQKIHDEIRATCNEFIKTNEEPFNPKDVLGKAVSNIVCSIVFGSRFEYSDERFTRMLEMTYFHTTSGGVNVPENFVPWLRFFNVSPLDKIEKGRQITLNFVREMIDEHRETFDENNIRDFVDLYLKQEKEQKADAKISGFNIMRAIQDLFSAGTETISTTLKWCLLYMIKYPDVQEKCRKEIHDVVGNDHLPSLSHKVNLVYTEATLLEIQRLANTAASSLPHCVTDDVTIRGYQLPKNTVILANIYGVHMDPNIWKNPEIFNPDRWIDESGKIIRSDAFMPFSIGRRACLGEGLAKMELFLYFSGLLQNFFFSEAGCTPDTEGAQGITTQPKHFLVKVKKT